MVVVVATPEHTDEVLGRMEHTLQKVHTMKQAGRRASLAGAEMDLMKLVAETRDIMQTTLQRARHHHELLVEIFGGDFVRISRSRAILDHIFFSDAYSAGKQVEEGLQECQAVEDVLRDLGYDVVLQEVQAQELLAFLERVGCASEEEKAAARAKLEAASAAAQKAAFGQAKEREKGEALQEEEEESLKAQESKIERAEKEEPTQEEAETDASQGEEPRSEEEGEETEREECGSEEPGQEGSVADEKGDGAAKAGGAQEVEGVGEEKGAPGEEGAEAATATSTTTATTTATTTTATTTTTTTTTELRTERSQQEESEVAQETKPEWRVRGGEPGEGGAVPAVAAAASAAEGEGAQSEEEQRRQAEEAVRRLEQAKQAKLLPSLKTQEALDLQEIEKRGAVEVVKAQEAAHDAPHPEPAPGARFIVLRHASLVGQHGTLLQPARGAGRWAARMDSGRSVELEASQFEVAPAPLAQVSFREPIEFKGVHHGDPPIATYKEEAGAMRLIKDAASVLKVYSSAVVSIEGHTATPESKMDEWAQALAQGRADKIKAAFVSLGVDQSRLKPIGLPGKLGGQKHDVVLKLVSF